MANEQSKAAKDQVKAGTEQVKANVQEQMKYGEQMLEKLFEANEKALEGAFELAEANTDMFKKFSKKQAQFVGALMDYSRRQQDVLAASKDPAALMGLQAQLGESVLEQWTNFANELPEIGNEASKRYTEIAKKMFSLSDSK